MKIIRKESKFGYKKNQRFYHERFDSYREFYDVLMSRQDKNPYEKIEDVFERNSKGWIGVDSLEEAEKLLLNGWQQNVEKMKVAFKKELNVLEQRKPCKMINSISGFMPIVPNALLGLPNSMIDIRISQKKTKILNFMISIDRGCGNNVETIINKMSKMFAYIAMIERSGQYRCRIEVFFTAFGDSGTNGTNTSMSILVKNENQLFDIKRLCFPVIHPAMLRLYGFAWNESLPLQHSDYRVSGYGRSFEYWGDEYKEDFIKVITTGNEKTICLHLNSDIEEMFGKEVK